MPLTRYLESLAHRSVILLTLTPLPHSLRENYANRAVIISHMQPLATQNKRERQQTELRQQARYRVEFPVNCTGDYVATGTVYNLGLGGCKIMGAVRVTVDIGAILNLELHPPNMAPIQVHAATVRWTMEDDFGVDFLGMQESERDRLAQLIDQLAEEP